MTGSPASPSLVERAVPWLALATGLAFFVRTFDNPGTADVAESWLLWIPMAREGGPVAAFVQVGPDYPPLAFAMFYLIARIADWFGTTDIVVLKSTIVAGAVAGVAAYGVFSRHLGRTAVFLWAMFIEAACLAYLDAWLIVPMLVAIVALRARLPLVAGLALGLAASLKFQPLVIAPLFALEACRPPVSRARFPMPVRRDLLLFGVGMALMAAIDVLGFGATNVLIALDAALSHQQLSGQALNANWVSHVAIGGGINTPDSGTAYLVARWGAKGVFVASYGFLLVCFWMRRETFRDFLWFATAAGTVYFVFNPGVHENHIFIAVLMGFSLWAVDPERGKSVALFLALAMNVNLLAFYNLDGQPAFYTSMFNVATVPIALVNTAFALALLWTALQRWRGQPPATGAAP